MTAENWWGDETCVGRAPHFLGEADVGRSIWRKWRNRRKIFK